MLKTGTNLTNDNSLDQMITKRSCSDPEVDRDSDDIDGHDDNVDDDGLDDDCFVSYDSNDSKSIC